MPEEINSKDLVPVQSEWTTEQVKLIANTVAKNATPDELKLFLYRCKNMGLDPLKPGHAHFVKYKDRKTGEWSPGTMIVGIDGLRAKAAATGKHVGTTRGILRDDKGRCIGAWAEIFRSDWQHPAREEVSLIEYAVPFGQWQKMPETMIKKVAESAALRIAFPELADLYSQEEMDQAGHTESQQPASLPASPKAQWLGTGTKDAVEPGEYVIPITKEFLGKKIKDVPLERLKGIVNWYLDKAAQGTEISMDAKQLVDYGTSYIEQKSAPIDQAPKTGMEIPF